MFQHLINKIGEYFSGANAKDVLTDIYRFDRWSSFDKYHLSSKYCEKKLNEYGIKEVEIIDVAADGVTKYGDWIMPLAWDVNGAELMIAGTDDREQVLLASYKDNPCSLVMWSSPTPPDGILAEVVILADGTKDEDYADMDVKGKIVFTPKDITRVKPVAVRHGVAGIISDFIAESYYRKYMDLPDGVTWVNTWMDYERGGWGFKRGDKECFGFMLSPRQGRFLRNLITKEGKVNLLAKVDTRIYEGTLDMVTGLIPGETKEEVLLLSHLFEYGASDNASGVGLGIELLHSLNELISQGKLPKPKRRIRILSSFESHGIMAYVCERTESIANAVAGINVDNIGSYEALCAINLTFSPNPDAQCSYTDTLLRKIAETLSKTDRFSVKWSIAGITHGDSQIADPMINVPSPLIFQAGGKFYHNSADTPDTIDPDKLQWLGKCVGTYLYFIANAGYPEACWLAEAILVEAKESMLKAPQAIITEKRVRDVKSDGIKIDLAGLSEHFDYLAIKYAIALDSVMRLVNSKEDVRRLREFTGLLKNELEKFKTRELQSIGRYHFSRRGSAKMNKTSSQKEISKIVPRRLIRGPIMSWSNVPREMRKSWDEMRAKCNISGRVSHSAETWTDGKRDLAQITRLVEQETGTRANLLEYYKHLSDYGYIKLVRSN